MSEKRKPQCSFALVFQVFELPDVHLSDHQSSLAKPTRLTKFFQMILSTKSHFDKMLTVIFKSGYWICIDNSMICSDIWHK